MLAPGTRLCALAEVDDGGARTFTVPPAQVEVIVARRGDRCFAYHNRCAHLSVPLNLLDRVEIVGEMLVCDHHSARFRIDDGSCTMGPCKGDALAGVPLAIRSGDVFVAEPVANSTLA